jgi:hypothetical protein
VRFSWDGREVEELQTDNFFTHWNGRVDVNLGRRCATSGQCVVSSGH